MIILQFQFTEIEDEREQDILEDFCKWITQQMYTKLYTDKYIRRKIQLRINYFYTAPWIKWIGYKDTDVETILQTIQQSFSIKKYRHNVFKIRYR